MTVKAPDRNLPLHAAIAEAVRTSPATHRQIAESAGLSLSSFRAKLAAERPWRMRDLAGVAAGCGELGLAARWVDMMRLGDLDIRA